MSEKKRRIAPNKLEGILASETSDMDVLHKWSRKSKAPWTTIVNTQSVIFSKVNSIDIAKRRSKLIKFGFSVPEIIFYRPILFQMRDHISLSQTIFLISIPNETFQNY